MALTRIAEKMKHMMDSIRKRIVQWKSKTLGLGSKRKSNTWLSALVNTIQRIIGTELKRHSSLVPSESKGER